MENRLEVTFEGDHILVHADGVKDFLYIERLWREVAAACDKHDCYNVLGIANTTTPVEAVEGYERPAIFQQYGIGQRYRIAWVENNEDARDVIEFIAAVLANRGLPGRLFESEASARALGASRAWASSPVSRSRPGRNRRIAARSTPPRLQTSSGALTKGSIVRGSASEIVSPTEARNRDRRLGLAW